MQDSERQIDVVRDVMVGSAQFPSLYDLYLTDKRLIAIRSTRKYDFVFWVGFVGGIMGVSIIGYGGLRIEVGVLLTVIAAFVGGLIGAGMDKALESRNKRKLEQLSRLTLDDLLKRSRKNFALSYENIEKLRFYKVGFRQNLDVVSKEMRKTFGLTATQFNKLGNVFSSIDHLKEKIEK